MQAGGIHDDETEEKKSQNKVLEEAHAASGSETATGIAAVEGLLSGLALSESAAEQPAAPNSAGQAAAGGKVQAPVVAAGPAALAADDSTLQPANAAGNLRAPALAEDTQCAQADAAEEDDKKISVEGIATAPSASLAADKA